MTEWFHYDQHTGGFVIETQQDVSAIVEVNRAQYNATEKHTRYGELAEVARVPLSVLLELSKQGFVTPTGRILDEKKYKAWLNDPANSMWRVRRGRV